MLGNYGDVAVLAVASAMVLVWLLFAAGMKQPSNLQSFTLRLDPAGAVDSNLWAKRLLGVTGVEEVVVVAEECTAYLKVDNNRLDKEQLMQLSRVPG